MLFYYRCKYVLDFYIVWFLSMLSQAVVFIKIFNLLYKRLIFILTHRTIYLMPLQYKVITSSPKHVQTPVVI